MTPRSRRYFTRKYVRKGRESMFAVLMPIFEGMMMAADAYAELMKPRRLYPHCAHPGGPAFVGDPEPEIVKSEGMWQVMIKNAFTPFADGVYVKIETLTDMEKFDEETKPHKLTVGNYLLKPNTSPSASPLSGQ